MSDDPNKGGGRPSRFTPLQEAPPNKLLQWFLVGALLISGAAVAVQEWTQMSSRRTQAQLRRADRNQSEYVAHCTAGQKAFARKQYDEAASEYRVALQWQDNPKGHELLGEALLKEGNPDAGIAEFGEALRLNPKLAEASSAWGHALLAEGKPDEASGVLRAGLEHNPDAGLLHYDLATALLQMGTNAEGQRRMATEALSHFTEASRNGMDIPAFWCSYGQLLNQQGQYSQAEGCLVRAVSEDAGMVLAQFQLAVAEEQLGKYAEAIARYEKVLALRADDPATLNNLALLYVKATNAEARSPRMAVQLALRACDATTSQNARYMDTLACAYAAAGDFFQAITWEDKAIHRARQLKNEELARELEGRQALFLSHRTQ